MKNLKAALSVMAIVAMASSTANADIVKKTATTSDVLGVLTGTVFFDANESLSFADAASVDLDNIFYGQNADFNPQNQNHIGDVIEATFGLSATALTNGVAADSTSGHNLTISSPTSFDYLAVHFGDNELVFKFPLGVTNFALTSTDNVAAFSNYRAFVTAVPEPEEWAMMMLGLPLMGWATKYRKSNSNSNSNQDKANFSARLSGMLC